MSPGDVSGHVHAIVGGSNFGPLYDYDNSQKSQYVPGSLTARLLLQNHSRVFVNGHGHGGEGEADKGSQVYDG